MEKKTKNLKNGLIDNPVRSDITITCDKCLGDFTLIIYSDKDGKYLCCPHCNSIYNIKT